MKKIILLLAIAFSISIVQAAELVIEFRYEGKNVFVSNPLRPEGTYCAYKVSVNDLEIVSDSLGANFEITLSEMGFKIGETIRVKIIHHDGCRPHILSDHSTN